MGGLEVKPIGIAAAPATVVVRWGSSVEIKNIVIDICALIH